ncbi:MAG: hypothetical protein R6V85_06975 [Polyangia bacterium]
MKVLVFRLSFPLALACAVFASGALAGEQAAPSPALLPVPVPGSPQARFDGAGSDSAPSSLVARGADGARLVASGRAVISATLGSRVEVAQSEDDGAPLVELSSGAFLVHVGKEPLSIRVGGSTLRAASVEVLLARRGESWMVLLRRTLADSGGARVVLPPDPRPEPEQISNEQETPDGGESPEKDGESAEQSDSPLEIETRYPLEPGEPRVLVAGRQPRPAKERDSELLKKAAERLERPSAPKTEAAVAPIDIESPNDFAVVSAGDASDSASEIEIEEVEIEIGSVEVCLD